MDAERGRVLNNVVVYEFVRHVREEHHEQYMNRTHNHGSTRNPFGVRHRNICIRLETHGASTPRGDAFE